MDKDRSKLNATDKLKCGAGRCKKPDKCIHLRSVRQQQQQQATLCSSAQVLYRGCNFQNQCSDEDMYYDCLSISDSDYPKEGNSCMTGSCKDTGSCKTLGGSNKLEDPAAVREALERSYRITDKLLQKYENHSLCQKACKATLNLTLQLVPDSSTDQSHCRATSVRIPLEFNPKTGQVVAATTAPICQKASSNQMPRSCKGNGKLSDPVPHHQHKQFRPCQHIEGPRTSAVKCACSAILTPTPVTVPVPAPVQLPLPMSLPLPLPSPEPKAEPKLEPEPKALGTTGTPVSSEYTKNITPPEPEPEAEALVKKQSSEVMETLTLTEIPPDTPIRETGKHYYLALPQHRDFSTCSPCRFEPSPIMDEEGNVFCPGHCGCCQCPWKQRTFDENIEHVNVKVCRCVQRGTIFSGFDERDNCSQTSYFDFCPCREKAEAKFLELYHCEMWSAKNAIRGREIFLDEIREIRVTPPAHS